MSSEGWESKAKTLREIFEEIDFYCEKWFSKISFKSSVEERLDRKEWVLLAEAQEIVEERDKKIDNLLREFAEKQKGQKQRLQNILENFKQNLMKKAIAGPPSKYQELWHLTNEFRLSILKEIGPAQAVSYRSVFGEE